MLRCCEEGHKDDQEENSDAEHDELCCSKVHGLLSNSKVGSALALGAVMKPVNYAVTFSANEKPLHAPEMK